RVDAGDGYQVARARLGDLDALEPLVAVEDGHLGELDRAVAVHHAHALGLANPAIEDAADDEPADVVVPVQHGSAELELRLRIEARRWDGGQDRVEQRLARLGGVRGAGWWRGPAGGWRG